MRLVSNVSIQGHAEPAAVADAAQGQSTRTDQQHGLCQVTLLQIKELRQIVGGGKGRRGITISRQQLLGQHPRHHGAQLGGHGFDAALDLQECRPIGIIVRAHAQLETGRHPRDVLLEERAQRRIEIKRDVALRPLATERIQLQVVLGDAQHLHGLLFGRPELDLVPLCGGGVGGRDGGQGNATTQAAFRSLHGP